MCPRNRTHGRTHVSPTPKKPEYLIARSQLTEWGPLGSGPIQFLMECDLLFGLSHTD